VAIWLQLNTGIDHAFLLQFIVKNVNDRLVAAVVVVVVVAAVVVVVVVAAVVAAVVVVVVVAAVVVVVVVAAVVVVVVVAAVVAAVVVVVVVAAVVVVVVVAAVVVVVVVATGVVVVAAGVNVVVVAAGVVVVVVAAGVVVVVVAAGVVVRIRAALQSSSVNSDSISLLSKTSSVVPVTNIIASAPSSTTLLHSGVSKVTSNPSVTPVSVSRLAKALLPRSTVSPFTGSTNMKVMASPRPPVNISSVSTKLTFNTTEPKCDFKTAFSSLPKDN
jgi:hypothetical protein